MKAARNIDTTGFDFRAADDPVKPTLASSGGNYHRPDGFRNDGFGIYMHWGLGTVVGFNHFKQS